MPFDVIVSRLVMDPAPGICVVRALKRAGKVTMVNHSGRQASFETQLEGRASVMRRNLTVSESALWRHLSGSKLGVAFRRQVPLERYIVDFLAPSLRLIVECYGSQCTPR
jgi:very-short-patch-repair endonuclease